MLAVPYTVAYSRLCLKQSSDFDVRVRGAPKLRRKIFGWLRNITNLAGIRLAAKKIWWQRGAG